MTDMKRAANHGNQIKAELIDYKFNDGRYGNPYSVNATAVYPDQYGIFTGVNGGQWTKQTFFPKGHLSVNPWDYIEQNTRTRKDAFIVDTHNVIQHQPRQLNNFRDNLNKSFYTFEEGVPVLQPVAPHIVVGGGGGGGGSGGGGGGGGGLFGLGFLGL